jgi:glutaredoxin
MKIFVRIFFKTLRIVIGPVMLLWEFVTRPKGLVRPPALQAGVDQQCRSIIFYEYRTCPFCIKVRQEMRRLSLKIERRDAQKKGQNREDLARGCGQTKVPCLKITDQLGHTEWMTDSGAIVTYLRGRFANG